MKPFQITVGGGGTMPAALGTVWNDTDRAGQDGWIERSGYGPLSYSDYQVLNTGGVQLLNGLTFGDAGDIWFWHATGLAYDTTTNSYTNGFNFSPVISALFSRIGFRQPTESAYAGIVDSPNAFSQSGRYFDGFHALCTARNLKEVQPDPDISNVNFNAYLTSLKRGVIMRALNGVFSVKEFIEQRIIYDRVYHSQETVFENTGQFAGIEICIAPHKSRSVQIDSVTMLLDASVADLPLYLFCEGKKSPIWNTEVTISANENTTVQLPEVVLNYMYGARGRRFYFGYFQDDLDAQGARAVREQVRWNRTSMFACRAFTSAKNGLDFDRNNISTTLDAVGLNLEMSSFEDHTNTIVKNAPLFDEAIGLTMAQMTLEQIAYSIRSNGDERLLKGGMIEAAMLQDLQGSAPISDGPPPIAGLRSQVQRELKRVKDSLHPKVKAQTVNLC